MTGEMKNGSDCGFVFRTSNFDPLENPLKVIELNKIRQISSLAEGIVSIYLSLENIEYTFQFSNDLIENQNESFEVLFMKKDKNGHQFAILKVMNDLIVKHLLETIESRVPCFHWHSTTNMAERVYNLFNKNF